HGWSADVVPDQPTDGRRRQCLTGLDAYPWENFALSCACSMQRRMSARCYRSCRPTMALRGMSTGTTARSAWPSGCRPGGASRMALPTLVLLAAVAERAERER